MTFQPSRSGAAGDRHGGLKSLKKNESPHKLIINNDDDAKLLTMDDCIRVQEEAFKKMPSQVP